MYGLCKSQGLQRIDLPELPFLWMVWSRKSMSFFIAVEATLSLAIIRGRVLGLRVAIQLWHSRQVCSFTALVAVKAKCIVVFAAMELSSFFLLSFVESFPGILIAERLVLLSLLVRWLLSTKTCIGLSLLSSLDICCYIESHPIYTSFIVSFDKCTSKLRCSPHRLYLILFCQVLFFEYNLFLVEAEGLRICLCETLNCENIDSS